MVKKTIVTYVDDIDGSENASTVAFAFEGKSYSIDLSDKNKGKLADALAPYIKAGQSAGTARGASNSRSKSRELQKIRDWAAANGIQVSPRGRIAASVVDQYNAAN